MEGDIVRVIVPLFELQAQTQSTYSFTYHLVCAPLLVAGWVPSAQTLKEVG